MKTKRTAIRKKQTNSRSAENDLLRELKNLNNELELAYKNFQNQTDDDLLNASIFRLNEVGSRYSYAVKKAKEYGIKSKYFRFNEKEACVTTDVTT